jgi:hypothetical protein
MRCLVVLIALLFLAACTGEIVEPDHNVVHENPDSVLPGTEDPDDSPADDLDPGPTVAEVAGSACSTQVVSGLSAQLITELECMTPGLMRRIDDLPHVELAGGVWPVMQSAAGDALAGVNHSIYVNSGLRTLAQQFVLYHWYTSGLCTNVVSLAARPGRSNHESGLALDVANYSDAKSALQARGFSWLGAGDPVHYDYQGGTDLRDKSVLAFQRLWNLHNPGDLLVEDGLYGPNTEAALLAAPAGGFPGGASCAASYLGPIRPHLGGPWLGDIGHDHGAH